MKKPNGPSKRSRGKSVPITMKIGEFTIDFAFNRPAGSPDAANPADRAPRDAGQTKDTDDSFNLPTDHE